ncbi:unnamed protein product [Soboliphyme baturini]|uniref:DNA-directed RNA polymerase n=1 Tax=Soboliphyme baturini TaxID=241478 RepID=A0A183ISU8_9BILA|nr:unnamed protein product [Soboliphyme baturini]
MRIHNPCYASPSGVSFGIYSSEAIKAISVKEISNPRTFDDLQHPVMGGLYDSALGPLNSSEQCSTCTLTEIYCPGHFGHISLPLPVYNPLLFDVLFQVCVC